MNMKLLTLYFLPVSLLFAHAASAQQPDIIKLRTRHVAGTVTSETYSTLRYRADQVEGTAKQADVLEVIWGDKPAAYAEAEREMAAGKYEDAAKLFQDALRSPIGRKWWLEPYSYYGTGEALRLAGKLDEAIPHYQAVIEKHKEAKYVPHSHLALGSIFYAQGEYEKARRQFAAVAEAEDDIGRQLFRDDESLLFAGRLGMAKTFTKLGKADEAQARLAAIAKEAKGKYFDVYFDARRQLAYAKISAKQVQEGISEYQAIIDEAIQRMKGGETPAPEERSLQSVLAKCYIGLADAHLNYTTEADRVKEALLQYLRVIVVFADSTPEEYADALAGAAQCLLKLDKKQQAARWYNVLKEKFPNHPGVYSIVIN